MNTIPKNVALKNTALKHAPAITYFISDLHLHPSRPAVTKLFFKFLKEAMQEASSLYILGDFFEVFVGDDCYSSHDIEVIQALADCCSTGLPVYFMHGNRDFLLGKKFALQTGCILIPDPFLIEINNERFLLAHGDKLCTLDVGYQRYRKLVHNSFIKRLFLSFPLKIRQNIAMRLRYKNKNKYVPDNKNPAPDNKNNVTNERFDVTQNAVECLLKENNALTLIHGHTHKPGIHEFSIGEESGRRIVLGDWHPESCMVLKLEAKENGFNSLNLINIA